MIPQLAPAGSEFPQSVVRAKFVAAWMPEKFTGAVPVFLRVAFCASLVVSTSRSAKERLGDNTLRGDNHPAPERRRKVSHWPVASLCFLTSSVRVPEVCGVKATSMVQPVPAARTVSQVCVNWRSPVILNDKVDVSPTSLIVTVWRRRPRPASCGTCWLSGPHFSGLHEIRRSVFR